MKRLPFVPSPIALVSGVLLFILLGGWTTVAAAVVPALLELLRTSPRLAAIGILGLFASPMVVVAIAHHVGHRGLDRFDSNYDASEVSRTSVRGGVFPSVASWWAGAHAWLVLYGTSVLTSLVLLVIFPPEPQPDPDSFSVLSVLARLTSYVGVSSMGLHSIVWVVIAAQLYELERRARRRD